MRSEAKILDDPCPECGGQICLQPLCTTMKCTTTGCPFEIAMCSGVWVDATEYNRSQVREVSSGR